MIYLNNRFFMRNKRTKQVQLTRYRIPRPLPPRSRFLRLGQHRSKRYLQQQTRPWRQPTDGVGGSPSYGDFCYRLWLDERLAKCSRLCGGASLSRHVSFLVLYFLLCLPYFWGFWWTDIDDLVSLRYQSEYSITARSHGFAVNNGTLVPGEQEILSWEGVGGRW